MKVQQMFVCNEGLNFEGSCVQLFSCLLEGFILKICSASSELLHSKSGDKKSSCTDPNPESLLNNFHAVKVSSLKPRAKLQISFTRKIAISVKNQLASKITKIGYTPFDIFN